MSKVDLMIDHVLKGSSVSEAKSLVEATISPDKIDEFVNSAAYKGLVKNAQAMLYDLENNEDYKRGKFTEDPIQALEDEADNCEYVSNLFRGFNIEDYPAETKGEVTKILNSLRKGASTIRNKIAKLSRENFIGSDGKLKMRQVVNKAGEPQYSEIKDDDGNVVKKIPKMQRDYPYSENDYTARALRGITAIFKLLGVPWDYDPDWFDYIKAGKNRPIDSGVPESVQKDIVKVITSARNKFFFEKDLLKESLGLSKDEAEFFDSVWKQIVEEN